MQHAGMMMSTLFSPHAPVWFASGTACAFIFLRGVIVLPGIAAGTFEACYLAHHEPAFAALYASLFVIQTYLLMRISYCFAIPTLVFYRSRLLIQFLLTTIILTGLITFVMATAYPFHQQLWLQWWLADFIGIISFAFGILALDAYFPQSSSKPTHKRHVFLLYGTLGCLILGCLLTQYLASAFYIMSSLLVLNIIISIYFGWCGAVSALFMSSLLFGLGAYLNAPIYDHLATYYFQAFLIINMMINLQIGVRTNEKILNQ